MSLEVKLSIQNSANIGDSDQTPPSAASDLDLHSLPLSRKRNLITYELCFL